MNRKSLKIIEICLISVAVLCLLFAWTKIWFTTGDHPGEHVRGPLAKKEYYKYGDINGYLTHEFKDKIESLTPREAFSRGLADNLELCVAEDILTREDVDELLSLTRPESSSADLDRASDILLRQQDEALAVLKTGADEEILLEPVEGYIDADFVERVAQTGPDPEAPWIATTMKGALVEGCIPEDLAQKISLKTYSMMFRRMIDQAKAAGDTQARNKLQRILRGVGAWERARIREIENLRTMARLREFILVQQALEFESPASPAPESESGEIEVPAPEPDSATQN